MRRLLFEATAAFALVAALSACESRTAPPAVTPAPAATRPVEPRPVEPRPVEPSPGAPAPSVTGIVSAGGSYFVEFHTVPDPVPLNELFAIEVSVSRVDARDEPLEGVELMVDGRMPAHRHGMTREPRIERRPDGTFAVTGMLFHMPGDWELHFDVTHDGTTERAQADVVLE